MDTTTIDNTIALEKIDLNSVEPMKVELDNHLSKKDREKVAADLSVMLANSYLFMLKVQNYHWNVRGGQFKSVHELTEEQYNDLFSSIDEIAERIRALGYIAPGTFKEYNSMSHIKDGNAELSLNEMVAELVKDHEIMVKIAKKVVDRADEYGDDATADMLTSRIETHDKYAWMLRSMLEK